MLNFTNRFLRYNEPNLRVGAKDYLTYDMGPTSTLTVAAAKKYAAGGFRRPHPREERRVHAGDRLHPRAAEGE